MPKSGKSSRRPGLQERLAHHHHDVLPRYPAFAQGDLLVGLDRVDRREIGLEVGLWLGAGLVDVVGLEFWIRLVDVVGLEFWICILAVLVTRGLGIVDRVGLECQILILVVVVVGPGSGAGGQQTGCRYDGERAPNGAGSRLSPHVKE